MKQSLLQKSIELNEKLLEALIGPHEGLVKELIELKEDAKAELGNKTPIPDSVNQKPLKHEDVTMEEQNKGMKPNDAFDTPQMPEPPQQSTNISELI